MPNILRRLKINEVSSVDRGAGEGVRVMLVKRDDMEGFYKKDYPDARRREMAANGEAMKDGSYPIADKGDLHDAIHAVGRGKNNSHDAIRRHIMSRARALGLTSEIPDDWKDGTSKMLDVIKAALGMGPTVATTIDSGVTALEKVVADILADDKMDKAAKAEAVSKAFDDYAAHMDGTIPEAITNALVAAGIHKEGRMADETEAERKAREAKGKEGPKAGEGDGGKDDGSKSKVMKLEDLPADVRKQLAEFDALKKSNETMEKALADLLADKDMAGFRKRAVDVGMPEAEAETIAKAMKGDAAAVGKLLDMIKALHAQVAEAGLFKEAGDRRTGGNGASADAELRAKAAELRKMDPKLTDATAYAKAYVDPANAGIVKRIKAEENR